MKRRIPFILILFTICVHIVQSKQFSCVEPANYQCIINGVTVQDTSMSLTYSNYVSGKYGVRNLTMLNSTMDDIPESSQTSSLLYLNCVGCGLIDITKHSFSKMGTLITLNISFGSYEKLHKKLFSHLPELTYLNASHGAIVEVDETAFSNLEKLTILDLSFNNITKITSKMFAPLMSLWYIYLRNNHIKILSEDLFINNIKLKYLYLEYNEISQIDGRIFSPQHIATVVALSYNELTELDTVSINAENIWVNNNKLKQLSIASSILFLNAYKNYIEKVVCDESSTQISILYMTYNSLTELGCIGSLTELTSLDLSYNNFGKLNHSSFAALTKIKTLGLKSANIGKLEFGVFSHQNQLEKLDISYNQMGNIALEMLLAAKGLQKLYIDGNNITEFSFNDLKMAFTNIQTISIGDNDFNCTFLAEAIKQLNSKNIETIVSTGSKVTDSHNINGIGCQVKKEKPTPSWVPVTNEKTTDHRNTTNNEFEVKLDAIIQQVEVLSAVKAENDKTFAKLRDDIIPVKESFTKVNNDILSNKAEILKLQLTKIDNATNSSNTMLWTLINQLNNITLEKQQVSNRAQMQEINELKFQIDKNSYKLSDVATKVEKLMKIEQTTLHSSHTIQTNSNSDYAVTVIMNLNIILITLVIIFCIYKGYKFVKNDLPRIRRYNSANTLHTNIEMDNDSARQ